MSDLKGGYFSFADVPFRSVSVDMITQKYYHQRGVCLMKKYLTIIGVVLIIFAWQSSHGNAESSWWDKGVNTFKKLQEGSESTAEKEPSYGEIGEAFKEALRIGTDNVVTRLGITNGFNNDPFVHIPLPEEFKTIKTMLSKVGMSQHVDELELKLNRAAESAVPKAKDLLFQAISEMTFDDLKNIYEGPEDSATKYFRSTMSPRLREEMLPIVENTLSEVGAIEAYDHVIGQYKALPFVPDVKANLNEHVVQKGMDGIFYYLAKEEANIRKNPVRQTTKLLKKVFGVK